MPRILLGALSPLTPLACTGCWGSYMVVLVTAPSLCFSSLPSCFHASFSDFGDFGLITSDVPSPTQPVHVSFFLCGWWLKAPECPSFSFLLSIVTKDFCQALPSSPLAISILFLESRGSFFCHPNVTLFLLLLYWSNWMLCVRLLRPIISAISWKQSQVWLFWSFSACWSS